VGILIDSYLDWSITTVKSLAGLKELKRSLASKDAIAHAETNEILDRFKDTLKTDVIYLMDRNGNTVASSNRDAVDSFVGNNYGFRPYFQQAMKGIPSVYVAVGVTSKKRGIYFSHPVYGKEKDGPLGVAVVKGSVELIEKALIKTHDGIISLTDPHGVVFVSNRAEWDYHLLWEASSETIADIAGTRQFGKGPWSWTGVKLENKDQAVDNQGNKYRVHRQEIANYPGWHLVYLHDLKAVSRAITAPLLKSAGFSVILCVFFGFAIFFLYKKAIVEIMKRKKVEEKLQEGEAKYRALFDNAPIMDVTTCNQEGVPIITDCNKLFADTLGYARDELLQQPLRNLYTSESGRELMEGGGYERTLAGGIFAEERQLVARNGSVVETLIHALPEKYSAGVVCGSRAMFVDITQRKKAEKALQESEERFRALFEQASIGVAEIDTKTGRFVRINQKYCDIAGYSLAEMMAMTYMQITHPDDLQADLDNVRKIGEGEIRVYYREKRYVRKDGAIVWVHLAVSPILEKGEQSGRHIAMVEDITERKLAEEQRNQLILKLQRALDEVKTLSGLLPICSHCKKIRDDKGYWSQIETYIHRHSGAEFSHGICPECAKKHYPEYDLYEDAK
jgi:PAS domain S-box-containing protein